MLVNCENSSTRRPSSTSSSSISIRRSSLAESCAAVRGACVLSRRGSQQTWRSLSSASRMTIWLRARPVLRRSRRAPARPSRGARSRRGRAARRSARPRAVISVFGGSSLRHLLLGAAQQEGRTRGAARCAGARRRPASRSACGRRGGRPRCRRGSPASGSRTATTARPGGSPAACRSGTGGGGAQAGRRPGPPGCAGS